MYTMRETVERELGKKRLFEIIETLKDPKTKGVIGSVVDNGVETMFNRMGSIFETDITPLAQNVAEEIKGKYVDDAQLLESAKEYVRTESSAEDFLKLIRSLQDTFFAQGDMDETIKSELDAAMDRIDLNLDRPKIVDYLTVVAEQRGLDEALSDEAECEALRSIYKTPEEYLDSIKARDKSLRDYMTRCTSILMVGGRKEQDFGLLMLGSIEAYGKMKAILAPKAIEEIRSRLCDVYGAEAAGSIDINDYFCDTTFI